MMTFATWKNRNKRLAVSEVTPSLDHPEFASFTRVSTYVERIMARSAMRGWGFTQEQADDLSAQLAGLDHAGSLSPVGVRIWLGHDLAYNWQEIQLWLVDVVAERDLDFCIKRFEPTRFFPGSEITGEPSLTAVGLSLLPPDKRKIQFPCQIRAQQQSWPSLEVPALLCLNPRMIRTANWRDRLNLLSLGLVHGSDPVHFTTINDYLCAYRYGVYDQLGKCTVVQYRDL